MLPIRIRRHKQGDEVVDEQEIEIPIIWEDVTLAQFMRLLETKNLDAIELLSIVTGLSREYCYNVPESAVEKIVKHIFFLTEEPPDFGKWKRPDEVLIQGAFHKVPTDLKKESWGQKVMAQQEMNAMIEGKMNVLSVMPYLLSVYFYSKVTGDKEYTDEKIRAFIPQIMSMKAMDAIPIATFFLSNCLPSSKLSQRLYLLNQLESRMQQELKDLTSSV